MIFCRFPFYTVPNFEEGFEGWSRFAGAKRFANASCFTKILTAKDAVDNGGAGRAAKGENPSLCAIEKGNDFLSFPFFVKTPLLFFNFIVQW